MEKSSTPAWSSQVMEGQLLTSWPQRPLMTLPRRPKVRPSSSRPSSSSRLKKLFSQVQPLKLKPP